MLGEKFQRSWKAELRKWGKVLKKESLQKVEDGKVWKKVWRKFGIIGYGIGAQ